MFDFQKQKKINSIIYSKTALFIILIILFGIVHLAYDFHKRYSESRLKKSMSEKELFELESRRKDLQSRIEYLDSHVGQENELRRRFDLLKEGEQVILLTESEKKNLDEATSSKNTQGFWQNIKGWFR